MFVISKWFELQKCDWWHKRENSNTHKLKKENWNPTKIKTVMTHNRCPYIYEQDSTKQMYWKSVLLNIFSRVHATL